MTPSALPQPAVPAHDAPSSSGRWLLAGLIGCILLLTAFVQVLAGVVRQAEAARQAGQVWPPQREAVVVAERTKAQARGDAASSQWGLNNVERVPLRVAAWSAAAR